jgi:hypothetical protein
MKISLKQLETVISKLKYEMLGYSNNKEKDVELEVSLTKENPGNGSMVDCLTLRATKPNESEEELKETSMSVEIYPASDKQDPVASKTQSFRVTRDY